MKINCIVWGINYAPEWTGIAPYNTALCEFLRSQGHQARMVTSFPYYPAWAKRSEDQGVWFRTDLQNGVPVHRCWHYVPQKPSSFKRILHELSFVMTSWLRIMTLPRPDVYVVVSPPLLLGFAAWLACVFKRTRFVFHVQDLQPDAAAGLGMVKSGLLLKALYALEAFAYRRADRVSGITPGMVCAFRHKGVAPGKTWLFPNGMDLPELQGLPSPEIFRKRLGLAPHELLAVYSGNLGVKHGVEILLEAARLIPNAGIKILICGDGARRQTLERHASELRLKNVILLPLQPDQEYLEMLAAADVYLVTQQPGSGSLFFPSKLLKGLALSKTIVVVADPQSELTRAALEGEFAMIADPTRPEQLAETLRQLAGDPEKRKTLGTAGRRYVEQFEQDGLLQTFAEQLGTVVFGPRPRFPRVSMPRETAQETVP